MRRIPLFLLILALIPLRPLAAQNVTPESALARLCGATTISEEWFSPQFLAAAPLPVVQQLFSAFREDFGGCLRVDRAGQQFLLIYERGIVTVARYALDAQGRFTSLIVQPRMVFRDLADAAGGFAMLPGTVALLVTRGGRPEVAVNADRPLAVGSTFKLSVLATLLDQIRAGRRRLDETVPTRSEWNSLPSGVVHTYASGTPVTVEKLAELMISISDNTATDMLIRLVGREAVEAIAPPRNRPFLMTRDAFVLKDPRHADLLTRWRNGDETARREVLRETATRPLLDPRSLVLLSAQGPLAPDVEWFYTAEELCAVMPVVAGSAAMRINPGIANPADWTAVAYKGGSEPGVLNFTTQLVRRDGAVFCVSATWNNTALLSDLKFYTRYLGLLELLKNLR